MTPLAIRRKASHAIAVACLLMLSPAYASSTDPGPSDYDDPIAWMDAVHLANRGRTRAALNAAATVGSYGVRKLTENSPPRALRSLTRSDLHFGGVSPWMWSRGHYGTQIKAGSLSEDEAFLKAMDAYCRAKAGRSIETPARAWACEDLRGKPIFVYLMETSETGGSFGKVVTADDPDVMLRAARLLAYLDPAERQAAERRVKQEAQWARAAAALDRQLQAEQAPERRKVGHRLCRLEGQFLMVGFVERFAPETDKVQIRVVDKYLSDGGPTHGYIRPSGFQPGILWDDPDQWRLCP